MKGFVHNSTVVFVIVLVGTLIATFTIGVINNHFSPFFPTVSLTGNRFPESGIFTFGLFASSVNWLVVCLLIFTYHERTIMTCCFRAPSSPIVRERTFLNKAHLFIGVLISIGFAGIASFRSNEDATINYVFIGITYFASWVYMIMGTFQFYNLAVHSSSSISIMDLRLKFAISTVSTLAMFGGALSIGYWLSSRVEILWSIFAIFEYIFLLSLASFSASYWTHFKSLQLYIGFESTVNNAPLAFYPILASDSAMSLPLITPLNLAQYGYQSTH